MLLQRAVPCYRSAANSVIYSHTCICYLVIRPVISSLTDTISAVGRQSRKRIEDSELDVINAMLNSRGKHPLPSGTYGVYHAKIKISDQVVFSYSMKNVKKRNSYTVAYSEPGTSAVLYGAVYRFISSPAGPLGEADTHHVVLLKPLKQLQEKVLPLLNVQRPSDMSIKKYLPILDDNFIAVTETTHLSAICMEDIIMKCFTVSTGSVILITSLVNQTENE